MKVENPIFIIGIGRSGTTIFHRIMARHSQIAWMSGFGKKFPEKPELNSLLMKAVDQPLIGKYLQERFKPWECHDFWEHHCKGFRRPCRDLIPDDVTEKNKNEMRKVLSKLPTAKRYRLMLKATGWPRIGYLSEIFNDAKFIHIIRDGRSVVNSMVNVGWWLGWSGPQNWRWGELDGEFKEEWERYDKSFIALAAIQWKIFLDAIEKGRTFIDESNFLQIKYEELCANTVDIIKSALDFLGLEWSGGFESIVKTYNLKSTNFKWRQELTPTQHQILEVVLADYLSANGYA